MVDVPSVVGGPRACHKFMLIDRRRRRHDIRVTRLPVAAPTADKRRRTTSATARHGICLRRQATLETSSTPPGRSTATAAPLCRLPSRSSFSRCRLAILVYTTYNCAEHHTRVSRLSFIPAKARECFHRRWFVCVCLSVTKITKQIVDGFAPNFMRRFLGKKGRPSSCFVTIGRGMWK